MKAHPRLGVEEAIRNLRSAMTRSLLIAATAGILGAGMMLLTLTEVRTVIAIDTRSAAAGAGLYTVAARDGEMLDALRCETAGGVDGIAAAGSSSMTAAISPALQPQTTARIAEVTPGMLRIVWPDLAFAEHSSVAVGVELASLGVRPGGTFGYRDESGADRHLRVDTVATSSSRLRGDTLLAVVAPPAGETTVCYVAAEPAATAAVRSLLASWFDRDVDIQEVIARSGLESDPQALLQARLGGFGWAIAAAMTMFVLLGAWWARRSEFALYRVSGLREAGMLAMFACETVVVGLLPAQLGAMIAVGIQPMEPLVAQAAILDLVRYDALLVLAPLIALLVLPRDALLDTLKGK